MTYNKNVITPERSRRIENDFTYHPPLPGQKERYEEMREVLRNAAIYIVAQTPDSREQSLALTKLEETMFWANAAIARNESEPK